MIQDKEQEQGASAEPTGLSPTVEPLTGLAGSATSIPSALQDCVGALQFILAFYEPGQQYLDTEAWKQAAASGARAYNRGAAELGWDFVPFKADGGSVYKDRSGGSVSEQSA